MTRLDSWKQFCAVFVLCAATVSNAQSFSTLASFDRSDGSYPDASLVQGADGNFYGATQFGGGNCTYRSGDGCGTIFKITPEGKLTRLYSFCKLAQCADGKYPGASLALATDGKFYGATSFGGASGCGTVFEITAAGVLTTLHNFENSDGCNVTKGLIQATDGNLYGTTESGGVDGLGSGTVFKITLAGKLTTLYSFCSQTDCSDGQYPEAPPVQATDGNFYGTTFNGGADQNDVICPTNGCGTVFKITSAGALTTIYRFCSVTNCADGYEPAAALVQATDGNFYGTTLAGGANCSPDGCGTVFRITQAGTLTTLYSFCTLANCADGMYPSSLVQATDGNFYGTTSGGCAASACSDGTIFEITRAGTLTTLYSFCLTGCADGNAPLAGLLQATDGIFYGTTEAGGASNNGTVFSLATGLGPFVSFVRNAAHVGQEFGILGQGFTGTTSVSLNGVPASFKVRANTLLTATVPAGATTGYVTVTTSSGKLVSNIMFHVIR